MKGYADTNFFTRLYLAGQRREQIEKLFAASQEKEIQPLPVTWLHRIEVRNALELHVFTGTQAGHKRVTPEQAAIARALFDEDLIQGEIVASAVLKLEELEARFDELSLRHTANYGFRTYDVLHVSSAILLGAETFWSFDAKASLLARLEGLEASLA